MGLIGPRMCLEICQVPQQSTLNSCTTATWVGINTRSAQNTTRVFHFDFRHIVITIAMQARKAGRGDQGWGEGKQAWERRRQGPGRIFSKVSALVFLHVESLCEHF
jgi:hypothetical protein